MVQANGEEGERYGRELLLDYDVTHAWRTRAGEFIMKQNTWHKPWSADLERGMGEKNFPRNPGSPGWPARPDLEFSAVGCSPPDDSHPETDGANSRRENHRSVGASLRRSF